MNEIDRLIKQMPRVENPYATEPCGDLWERFFMRIGAIAFKDGTEAQCRLLAEQRWVKLPSADELYKIAREIEGVELVGGMKHSLKFYIRLRRFCEELLQEITGKGR